MKWGRFPMYFTSVSYVCYINIFIIIQSLCMFWIIFDISAVYSSFSPDHWHCMCIHSGDTIMIVNLIEIDFPGNLRKGHTDLHPIRWWDDWLFWKRDSNHGDGIVDCHAIWRCWGIYIFHTCSHLVFLVNSIITRISGHIRPLLWGCQYIYFRNYNIFLKQFLCMLSICLQLWSY